MIPVILSGGSGTRLWPVSRASYPKQFCEFYDQSFLKNSINLLKSEFGSPYILTLESMRTLTLRSLLDTEADENYAIYEPFGKNTAPAVALLCLSMLRKGFGSEVVGVFPADHLVTLQDNFEKAVKLAVECAAGGDVVTLGIQPSYAATGYGYIETLDQVVKEGAINKAHLVKGFREKPTSDVAKQFLESGNCFWNAGIFFFKVDVMINHFKEFLPELWKKMETVKDDFSNLKYVYANIESESLDYGIMEKLERQVCIPCEIGWSDMGSWDELSRLSDEQSDLQSYSGAQIFSVDSSSNYVFSVKEKVVGLVGVHDLIVVETPDGLLISKKGQSEKVKELVDQVKLRGLTQATEHLFEVRPWGGYEILSDADEYKVKTIKVEPGAQLSYQSHTKRAEHWVVVKGYAEVVLDGETKTINRGEFVHIPTNSRHRIRNVGKGVLVFVEVQTGEYFGEDDVTRYEDDYNRC